MKGIALCAKKIELDHPVSGKRMFFEIDLPLEFSSLLNKLR